MDPPPATGRRPCQDFAVLAKKDLTATYDILLHAGFSIDLFCNSSYLFQIMLRDTAEYWMEMICRLPSTRLDFLNAFDAVTAARRNFCCTVSGDLTRNRKPYLIHHFEGELFFFELSLEQTAQMGLKPNSMAVVEGQPANPAPSEITVSLGDCELVALPDPQHRLTRITGTLEVLENKGIPSNWAVEAAIVPAVDPHRVTAWDHPASPLQPGGTIQVSFDISTSGAHPVSPAAVFLYLCTTPAVPGAHPEAPQFPGVGAFGFPGHPASGPGLSHMPVRRTRISNVAGTLIDCAAPT